MRLSLTLVLFLFLGSLFAQEENLPKLSATTKQYLWKQKNLYNNSSKILKECVYRQDANGTIYLASFIKVTPFLNENGLESLNVMIGSKSKNIWTAYVPLEHVEAFTKISGIEYIDVDRPTAPLMDEARVLTRVDSVHAGINLPQAYDGKDVVVGIIDAGFDYTHPAVFDTAYSTFRLKSVWEQKGTGTAPSGFGFGAEYTDSASIFNQGTDHSSFSHGAHVAGIAAGSGFGGPTGDNELYRGMAYNSDLVYVAILPELNMWLNTGLTDMIDGVNYIYDYAASVGKPAVANLSWGNPIGPHDGLALFSQACDNATGPGKIFVLSSGNNAGKKVHLQKTFTPTDTIVKTLMQFHSSLPSKTNWVDIWGDTIQNFCIQFSLKNVVGPFINSAVICVDDQTHQVELIGANGDTCFVTVTTVTNEFNGKSHMLLDIYSRATEDLVISAIGQDGTINMWQGYVLGAGGYYGAFTKSFYSWATNGDDAMASSDMASTNSALAVGAYTSRATFTNVSGSTLSAGQTLGDITTFSSHGPTADGRTKPNISGPGSMIASSINSVDAAFVNGGNNYNLVMNEYLSPLNGTTYSYAVLQGTSMSSPATAGIVALMLQANPTLDPYQIQNLLYSTAIKDSYTGTIPPTGDNGWGWGKVNAYGAIYSALNITGIYHEESSPLQGLLYPNPSDGNYYIELRSNLDEVIKLSLTDVNGRTLDEINWSVTNGINTYQPNWNNLAVGIYFVKLKGETGELNIKLIKQ
jgi:minor extracellular serine protease Vpr